MKPLVDQAYELSQLNWKTWKRLDSLLDEENAREVTRAGILENHLVTAVRGGSKINTYLETAIALNSSYGRTTN